MSEHALHREGGRESVSQSVSHVGLTVRSHSAVIQEDNYGPCEVSRPPLHSNQRQTAPRDTATLAESTSIITLHGIHTLTHACPHACTHTHKHVAID